MMRTPRLLPVLRLLPLLLLLSPAAEASADDAFQFQGDRLTSNFTAGQERTTLTGHARIVSGDLTIEADSIELWGKAFRFASCTGTVVVHDTKKNILLKSDTMEYDRTRKTSRFEGLCQLEDADHGVAIRSGLVDYDQDAEMLVLQAGVRIFKGDLVCRSEYAVYDRKADNLEMTGLPTVYKKRDLYEAGSIRVDLKTEDVVLDGKVSGIITPEIKEKKKDDKKKPVGSPGPTPSLSPAPTPQESPQP